MLGSFYICRFCNIELSQVDGISILVRDKNKIDAAIEAARKIGRASWYEDKQSEQWSGPYRHHLLKRKQYVEKSLQKYTSNYSKPMTGVDLGCGDGSNLIWLKQYIDILYASDYNLKRLNRASKNSNANYVFMADILDYPAHDNSFDVVFFNHVLEHIPDDQKALSEAYRILKPQGILILGIPNEGAAFWRLAYKLQPKSKETTDHVHFYTVETISKKCLQAGFHIKETKHLGWGMPHWTLDSRLREYKLIDDSLEFLGSKLFLSQSSSLYVILAK